MLDSINKMLQRPNLPEDTKFALLTCLANLNFDSSTPQAMVSSCNEIFMREFLTNCTTKDDSLSRLMNQCLRGLNKNLSQMKDVDSTHSRNRR